MNVLLAWPLEVGIGLVFVLGVCIGGALNLAIERLRWETRAWSPWFCDPQRTSPARWSDRLPLIGWYTWRRQEPLYGRGFWAWPLFIELLTGVLFAFLYWWEIGERGLLGPRFALQNLPPGIWAMPGDVSSVLHLIYQSHLILLSLMLVATFIDLADRVIPDSVTIPGTLAGLILAALVPWSLLPNARVIVGLGPEVIEFLKITSPEFWTTPWAGAPDRFSLWVGLGCFWGWCFALLPRHLRLRHGLNLALRILLARLVREPLSYLVLFLAIVGTPLIAAVWWQGGPQWAGLISSLVGMAAGGGLIWAVRIIGSVTLGKEAMGFGDVTLMAMIGAFLGWQSAVLIFFLAPGFGAVIGIVAWLLKRDNQIPYGPFLCFAALGLIVAWRDLWLWASDRFFNPPWLMPIVLIVFLGLMAIPLLGLRLMMRRG